MEIWKAAVLGIVQGLTEFLPISSSGHILLFERILRVDTAGADMYHTGEYMIWTDGEFYKCISDTVYSPEEYAAAWEKYDPNTEV